jgi:hypothetical protein
VAAMTEMMRVFLWVVPSSLETMVVCRGWCYRTRTIIEWEDDTRSLVGIESW